MSKSLTTRLKRLTPFAAERFGPHIISKTDETVTLHVNGKRYGEVSVWECKWCDWEGTHPRQGDVHISLKHDCDGIEWSESAKVKFEDEYE